jgi:hypothetical protein
MCIQSRKRREAKRKAIETEHKQRVERIRAKIESFYEDRKVKLLVSPQVYRRRRALGPMIDFLP